VDDDGVASETAVESEGICVECGELIPRERLATLADVFRCGECTRSYDAGSGPTAAERLGKTA
jgi:RNA polymerase-binding transcription factor DksA